MLDTFSTAGREMASPTRSFHPPPYLWNKLAQFPQPSFKNHMPCPCLRVRAEARPGMETSVHGSFASIEAVADEGHTFTGWTGSGVTDGNALSTTVLMDQNQSVTATFSRNAYTLRVYPGLGGNATGDGNFSHGSFASIEATPDEGYRFNGWSGMGVSEPTAVATSVLMNQDRLVSATFPALAPPAHFVHYQAVPFPEMETFLMHHLPQSKRFPKPVTFFPSGRGVGFQTLNHPPPTSFMDQNRSLVASLSLSP